MIVMMPPRHGKSSLISQYFPAWYLGTYPDDDIILVSYEADFAAEWGTKARDAFDNYMGPFSGLNTIKDRGGGFKWEIEGRYGTRGSMRTAGIRGPIVGKGADILIIDDPVKNQEEANSPTYRKKNFEWWRSTAASRLEPNARQILIMTRWHEEDLAGKIIKESKQQGRPCEIIRFPALAEDHDELGRTPGEALWPERFNKSDLESKKQVVGSYWWSAMYQQRPAPAEGGILKKLWFKYYSQSGRELLNYSGGIVQLSDLFIFMAVDLASSQKTSADYTVIGVWGLHRTKPWKLFLLDWLRDRLEGPDILPAVKSMCERNNAKLIGIESSGMQLAIFQYAQRDGLPVKELNPTKDKTIPRDKVTRAMSVTPFFQNQQVLFPANAPYLVDLETELLSFPQAPHDDQMDVVGYGCLMAQELAGYDPRPVKRQRNPEVEDRLGPPKELVANLKKSQQTWTHTSRIYPGFEEMTPP